MNTALILDSVNTSLVPTSIATTVVESTQRVFYLALTVNHSACLVRIGNYVLKFESSAMETRIESLKMASRSMVLGKRMMIMMLWWRSMSQGTESRCTLL
ncbi:hypothetical protein FCV25MIE_02160 [Fagus crenata]